MQAIQRISPCLWFDDQAEAAVAFYTGIFRNSRVLKVTHYGEAGKGIHGRKPGSVMSMAFEVDGQSFTALNGGPLFQFNEAISFQVSCDNQDEVDYYWERLGEGGDEAAQQCGWLKDPYGVSWQIVPTVLLTMINDPEGEPTRRVTDAMLRMKKLDIAELARAYDGH